MARYLIAIHPHAGSTLAELLWNIVGHGNSLAVQSRAIDLLRAMGLDEVGPPKRRL